MPTREQQVEWGKQGAIKQWGNITPEERFWKKVKKQGDDECWPWIACTTSYCKCTYGVFAWSHTDQRLAHRVAYELVKGDIPDGMFVCHACDNGICCNPKHLWLGTHKDNMQDMSKKGRWVGNKGMRNRWRNGSKYTAEFVKQLQAEHVPFKVTPQMLALKYGLTDGAVRALLWRSAYITDPNWKWK